MAKSYQLVAWTDKGQVRMIPSQLKAYISEEIEMTASAMGLITRLTTFSK